MSSPELRYPLRTAAWLVHNGNKWTCPVETKAKACGFRLLKTFLRERAKNSYLYASTEATFRLDSGISLPTVVIVGVQR